MTAPDRGADGRDVTAVKAWEWPLFRHETPWSAELVRLIEGLPDTGDALLRHWRRRPAWHQPPGPIKLQAKHIPDEWFLWLTQADASNRHGMASRWSGYDALMMPEKVVLAKARALIRRGLLNGCGCGCRGDFEVTYDGETLVLLAVARGDL